MENSSIFSLPMASRPNALSPSKMIPKFSLAVTAILMLSKGAQSWPWSSAVVVKTDVPNLNWVVDQILSSMSNEITKEHGQEMTIPGSNIDWHQSLHFYVLWFEAYGTAVAKSEAKIRNLNALSRISDAGILQEKKSEDSELVTLHAQIRIEDLEVRYSSIDVGVWFVTYSGGLTVKCPDNVFDIAVQFNNGESCTSTLKSAVIKELPSCTVELEQPGVLNMFKRPILSYAFGQMLSNIEDTENKALPAVLDAIIQKHQICRFLNPSATS